MNEFIFSQMYVGQEQSFKVEIDRSKVEKFLEKLA